jgi:hypothetical protein
MDHGDAVILVLRGDHKRLKMFGQQDGRCLKTIGQLAGARRTKIVSEQCQTTRTHELPWVHTGRKDLNARDIPVRQYTLALWGFGVNVSLK